MEIGPTLFGTDLPLSPDLHDSINATQKWREILAIIKSAEIPPPRLKIRYVYIHLNCI